jgi:hypothetical protein
MFWDRLKKSDFALIAEGPISAIKAHLVGGNIATLGKHVSQKQIRLIEDSGVDKIYLGLDADAVIECSTFASRTYLPVYRLDIPKKLSPDGKQVDLGDLEFSEVEYLVRTAKRWDATTSFAIPGL